jgi:hypothetical protein
LELIELSRFSSQLALVSIQASLQFAILRHQPTYKVSIVEELHLHLSEALLQLGQLMQLVLMVETTYFCQETLT